MGVYNTRYDFPAGRKWLCQVWFRWLFYAGDRYRRVQNPNRVWGPPTSHGTGSFLYRAQRILRS